MNRDFFSNHIGTSSELTMIADIRPGLVPVRESISYSSRLRRHLKMLSAMRRMGIETDRGGLYVGPIDTLRTLQYVKWTLIDNDTKMLLTVNFDQPLESYIRDIVDIAGPLLDTILCHCVGFEGENGEEGHYSDLGYHRFAKFPEKNQVEVELFAAAAPNFTVDDADYLIEQDAERRRLKIRNGSNKNGPVYDSVSPDELEHYTVGQQLITPRQKLYNSSKDDGLPVLHQALNIIRTMHESSHLFPKHNDNGLEVRDDFLYYRLAESLVQGFWTALKARVSAYLPLLQQVIGNFPNLPKVIQDAMVDGKIVLPDDDQDFWILLRTILELVANFLPDTPDDEPKSDLLVIVALLIDFKEALNWFAKRPDARKREPIMDTAPQEVELQVPIAKRPKKITHACLAFLRVQNAPQAAVFLRSMSDLLFPKDLDAQSLFWTLSITNKGLESLEIPQDVRDRFPVPFREGMAARAGMLGDTDGNHPKDWDWPKGTNSEVIDESSIDIIVQMQTRDPNYKKDETFDENDPTQAGHPLNDAYCQLKELAEQNGMALLGFEAMQRRPSEVGSPRGHLDFADGVSQPTYNGYDGYTAEREAPTEKEEPAESKRGDILIGRENSLDKPLNKDGKVYHVGEESRYERFEAPLMDGTFQVIRKTSLDVKAFQNVQQNIDGRECDKPDLTEIQEKMFGRKKDGTPLFTQGSAPYDNDFNYADDPKGETCPLQSHIRRANPRRTKTPRILRSGFSFGSFDHSKDEDRGLMFICYNANIAEQFELIQRWISGGNITGISSLHGDPILAPVRPGSNRVFRYYDANKDVVRVELPDKPLATLRWGLYAFVPSKDGLNKLASLAGTDVTAMSELAKLGAEVMEKRIFSVPHNQRADAWKILLEDRDHYRRDEREAVWAWIRETQNGVYDTGDDDAYGVLVGSAEGVSEVVLNEREDYSVREYWYRMKDSIGPQNLGFDRNPARVGNSDPFADAVKPGDYDIDADLINPFIAEYSLEEVFADAMRHTEEFIASVPVEEQPLRRPMIGNTPDDYASPGLKPLGKWLDLERLIDDVAAELSVDWFGLPKGTSFLKIGGPEDDHEDPNAVPHCPQDLLNASFYVFGPAPSPNVKEGATTGLTPKIPLNLAQYSAELKDPPKYTLVEKLKKAQAENPDHWTDQKIGEVLAGVTFGFVGPTPGSFLSVMYDWIDNKELWRVQQDLVAAGPDYGPEAVRDALEPWVLRGMRGCPIPDMLYRRTVDKVNLGGKSVEEDRMVTFSIMSAIADDPSVEQLLFGGDYWAPKKPLHSCPGQKMGLYTIYGVMAAIFKSGRLRAEGPLTLRLEEE
ncbi:MAG: Dyp-type peroxidase [Rhizobiaceae bacterium]|nr:Dyp-type peroxidase [Rhizobiaceae bacterium]